MFPQAQSAEGLTQQKVRVGHQRRFRILHQDIGEGLGRGLRVAGGEARHTQAKQGGGAQIGVQTLGEDGLVFGEGAAPIAGEQSLVGGGDAGGRGRRGRR